MWLVSEDRQGYRLFIDESSPLTSQWPKEVWKYLTHGKEFPTDGNPWAKLSKPLYIVIPVKLSDKITLFTPEFTVMFADVNNLYLTHRITEPVDWLGTATRRSYVIMWDSTHQYVLLEKLLDGTTYHLPGGHVDHHESSVDAAVREVREELNYTIDQSRLTPLTVIEYHPTDVQAPFDQYQVICYYEYATDLSVKQTTLVGDLREVSGLLWSKPKDIKKLQTTNVLSMLVERWKVMN